jgi:hypothetical protein
MLLFWPWGQTDPIENPLRALAFFSHQNFPFSTLFAGRFVPASNLPWTYLPTYVALALPELILVLLLCAPILAGAALVRGTIQISREQALAHLLLAAGIVFPVAFAIAIKAVLFDGMRHFIFVLPLAAVAAALVADEAWTRLARYRYRKPIYAVLGLYGFAHVSVMTMLHPDQYVYYNSFVGGVAGAEQKFKLDYWANSYAEAVQGLEDYLRTAYGPDFEERELTRADFFIAFTKDNCDRSLSGRPVYQVERMGALLSVVLDRRDVLAENGTAKRPVAGVLSKPTSGPDLP